MKCKKLSQIYKLLVPDWNHPENIRILQFPFHLPQSFFNTGLISLLSNTAVGPGEKPWFHRVCLLDAGSETPSQPWFYPFWRMGRDPTTVTLSMGCLRVCSWSSAGIPNSTQPNTTLFIDGQVEVNKRAQAFLRGAIPDEDRGKKMQQEEGKMANVYVHV